MEIMRERNKTTHRIRANRNITQCQMHMEGNNCNGRRMKGILAGCFFWEHIWRSWDSSCSLKEGNVSEVGGTHPSRGGHVDQGTEEEVAQHLGPSDA